MTEILVTAGPTREHLDDVRFLSNGSTGRMGYAIAEAAAARGCRVTLVSGPTGLPTPAGVRRVDVVSALELLEASRAPFAACELAFFVAAVADHRPARRDAGKPPKSDRPVLLELIPNPDVAATLCAHKGRRIAVGFALESIRPGSAGAPGVDAGSSLGTVTDLAAAIDRAREKLRRKHFELCVLNATDALGRADSDVVLLDAAGGIETLPRQSKTATAAVVVERALALRAKREDRT